MLQLSEMTQGSGWHTSFCCLFASLRAAFSFSLFSCSKWDKRNRLNKKLHYTQIWSWHNIINMSNSQRWRLLHTTQFNFSALHFFWREIEEDLMFVWSHFLIWRVTGLPDTTIHITNDSQMSGRREILRGWGLNGNQKIESVIKPMSSAFHWLFEMSNDAKCGKASIGSLGYIIEQISMPQH